MATSKFNQQVDLRLAQHIPPLLGDQDVGGSILGITRDSVILEISYSAEVLWLDHPNSAYLAF
jgi:hypothetical protein